jgi:hypothetical protein
MQSPNFDSRGPQKVVSIGVAVVQDPACYTRLTKLAARERNVQVIAMRNRKRQSIQNSYLRAVPFFSSFFREKKTTDMQIDG